MTSPALQPFDALDRNEIAAVLDKQSLASVAVLGDFCLDVYWAIDRDASEVSIETGLRTEPIRRQQYTPGGAGNVVMNLLALGVHRVYPVGVVGEDPFGRELRRLLEGPDVNPRGLITQAEGWATHTYIKPYVDNAELSRFDAGNHNRLAPETADALFAQLEDIIAEVSVVLINHQSAGSVHEDAAFRERLGAFIQAHPQTCFIVDSRGYHEAYAGAIHKLNDREVLHSCGADVQADDVIALDELVSRAGELQARWQAPLVITRGEKGCLVYAGEFVEQIFGIQLPGRSDPVGAGDTFVATLAATLSTGTNLAAAAFVANVAAAVTAQKLFQTGTAAPAEILELGGAADFAFFPELADAPHRARMHEASEIETVGERPARPGFRHVIFDHDGTISTLREGWEKIMEPMMLDAILGPRRGDIDETAYHRVLVRVRDFIERTTGIQTIEQMHGLAALVREFGYVPENEVLTPAEYKAVYNKDLKALVARRLAKLDRGELAIEDFTLKGAVPVLRALQTAGLTIYLASGTDEDDVKEEAERLGYADVFNGGIYGSVGEVDKDAKKIVIERILREVGGAYGQLLTFGDGPVEMRETVRRGAYAVGIASDELRRFGLNPAKRRRLIRAGAKMIAPDFSQWQVLGDLLGLPTDLPS